MAKPKQELEIIEEQPKKKDRKTMTLFFLTIPSVLIAMTSAIDYLVIRIGFQVVLLFYQFVVFKNMLDSYMGED
jgi:hypothetical protein